MIAIDVRHVSKSFGARHGFRTAPVQALDDITFTLPQGARVALMGPNGAGKTTLLRILAGTILPDRGKIRLFSAPPGPATRGLVAVALGEDRGFYPRLTVRQNLFFFGALNGFSRADCAARIKEPVEHLDLKQRLDQPWEELSTGNKQRVVLTRALFLEAPIVLLDEPTRSLDTEGRSAFHELLKDWAVQHETTLLFTTHDAAEAHYAEDVLTLEAGHLEAKAYA